MNFREHASRILGTMFKVAEELKVGKIDEVVKFYGKWWHEYELGKNEKTPPGNFSMSQEQFMKFLDGFGHDTLRKKVSDEIVKNRLAEKEPPF